MTSEATKENTIQNEEEQEKEVVIVSLYNSFEWLDKAFSQKLHRATKEFFGIDLYFKLIRSAYTHTSLWKGNDFFVTQMQFSPNASMTFKVGDDAANLLLKNALGKKHDEDDYLNLKEITELEAHILTGYNQFLHKKLEGLFISKEETLSILPYLEEIKEFYLTFSVFSSGKEEAGKLLLTFPCFTLKDLEPISPPEIPINIDYLASSYIEIDILVGQTKVSLEDIKQIEADDIVILENSNLYSMVIRSSKDLAINVKPNPSLLMNLEEENGEEIVSEYNQISKNIWDSLEVDVTAKFEKVKMKLGDLRQITEGLIVDIAPIAQNEIFIEVEGRQLAAGELVIVGDKYAIKITEILKESRAPQIQQHPQMILENPHQQMQQPHQIPPPQANPQGVYPHGGNYPQEGYPQEAYPQEAYPQAEYQHDQMHGMQQESQDVDESDFDFSDYEVDDDV